jgi:hypothetical protein
MRRTIGFYCITNAKVKPDCQGSACRENDRWGSACQPTNVSKSRCLFERELLDTFTACPTADVLRGPPLLLGDSVFSLARRAIYNQSAR